MRSVLLSLCSLLATQGLAQTTPPPPATPPAAPENAGPSSRDILDIPAGATVIEEKSLPLDISMNTVPSQIEGARQTVRGITDAVDRGKRGMRLYQFTMQPKETLKLSLKAFPSDKIVMSFAPPVVPDEVTAGIKRANLMPVMARTSRIELMNTTAQPYAVVLRLVGTTDVPYKLEITRK